MKSDILNKSRRIMFKKVKYSLIAFMIMTSLSSVFSASVFADYGIGASPMKQSIILNAGEKYEGSFTITNPSTNDMNFEYVAKVSPFFVTEDYNITYDNDAVLNQIVNWTKLDNYSGILAPNSTRDIHFTIDVPENAPAGGQYMAIVVQARSVEGEGGNTESGTGVGINQTIGIAHTVFAEIAGTTVRGGEIVSASVQSFLLSGNIAGQSVIKNTGNVHSVAKSILKVFPLFSDEEVYTNEENPETTIILPGRTHYGELIWGNTPAAGIFNVVYTVEFEGVTTQVSKLVIKCPIWLLFIIIFGLIAIILYFVMRAKARKNSRRRIDTE